MNASTSVAYQGTPRAGYGASTADMWMDTSNCAENFYAVAMLAIATGMCASSEIRLRQTIVRDDSSASKPWNLRPRTAQPLQYDSYRPMAVRMT
jgi:hypothetical protein